MRALRIIGTVTMWLLLLGIAGALVALFLDLGTGLLKLVIAVLLVLLLLAFVNSLQCKR